ncbi:MAG TPA: PIN domain-containing protein [archaeon]|nr:PIN domain-containing protein [archaeon]
MRIVLDANILFAALIKDGYTRKLLLFSGYDFFIPDFTIIEFEKHIPYLETKTGLSKHELEQLMQNLIETSKIKIVAFKDFSAKRKIALKISPDKNDTAYFALALKLKCQIWSNDSVLKKQGKIKVLTTKEISEINN